MTDQTVKAAKNENFQLKLQLESAVRELENIKLENEQFKEKIQELERWIVMLLNNFYQGNPGSLEQIQKGLQTIDDIRNEKFQLKKCILLERKKNNDFQEAFLDLKRKMKEREEDFKKSKKGDLVLQKQALEENLKLLSEEVETLSTRNERMLNDLKKQEFYQSYNGALEELNSLKQAHAALISTMYGKSGTGTNMKNIRDPRKSLSNEVNIPAGFSFAGSQAQNPSNSTTSSSVSNLISFFSCQGCAPSGTFNNSSLYQGQPSFDMRQNTGVREEYEAVMNQQEINFLAPNNFNAQNQGKNHQRSHTQSHSHVGGPAPHQQKVISNKK